MAKGFRLAGTLNEFIKDLDVLKNTEHSLIIWQNDAKGEKVIVSGVFESSYVEKDNTIINIRLENNQSFEKENPVYIFEKLKGILFKGTYEFCVNNVLKLVADNKVFLSEKRSIKRFYFHYTKVASKITFKHPSAGNDIEDKVNLRDICPGGFSFRCIPKKSKLFQVGDSVDLTNIGGIELPMALHGKVAHISKFKDVGALDGANLLVGISFIERSKLIDKVITVLKQEYS